MANKRMFALTIVDSDAFLDMPLSAQCLYFHLGMRADDEGFINNVRTIMRMVACKEDDLKLLIVKKFIIPFESGVVVIKHWNINNYIQNDRKHETKYLEEKSLLKLDEKGGYTLGKGKPLPKIKKGLDTECIQVASKMDPENRLDIDLDIDLDKKIKLDITRYKQKEFLQMLTENEYLTPIELEDYGFDELLTDLVNIYGYVDVKIKLKYFLDNYKFKKPKVDDKFNYLRTSLLQAFKKPTK